MAVKIAGPRRAHPQGVSGGAWGGSLDGFERVLAAEVQSGRAEERGSPVFYRHRCGYLPDRVAITEERFFSRLSPGGYLAALHARYRRFGEMFFRPRCHGCNLCLSLRVNVTEFCRSRGFRRVWKRNQDIRAEVGPARTDPAVVAVANAFHRHRSATRGWSGNSYTLESYEYQWCSGPINASQVRFYRGDRLLGVGLFDDLADGQTAVIFHYFEEWKPDSPGTFNILWLLERARQRGLPHVYLGYYVPGSQSTNYKGLFRPAEILVDGDWVPLPHHLRPENNPPGHPPGTG